MISAAFESPLIDGSAGTHDSCFPPMALIADRARRTRRLRSRKGVAQHEHVAPMPPPGSSAAFQESLCVPIRQVQHLRHQPELIENSHLAVQEGRAPGALSIQGMRHDQHARRLACQAPQAIGVAVTGHALDGFAISSIAPAPPVYDPDGLTCVVDDVTVADPEYWSTIGVDLLTAVRRAARRQGPTQIVARLDLSPNSRPRPPGLSKCPACGYPPICQGG